MALHRRNVAMRAYVVIKRSIGRVQTWWRCVSQTRRYDTMRRGMISHQAQWRRYVAKGHYLLQRQSIITIQRHIRGTITLWHYLLYRGLIIYTQACWRRRRDMITYRQTRIAILTLQHWSRYLIVRTRYLSFRSTITTLQSHTRRINQQKQYHHTLHSITILQRKARRMALERRYYSAVTIQRYVRGSLACWNYFFIRGLIIYTQACWRRLKALIEYRKAIAACVKIQGCARMTIQRERFKTITSSVIIVQSLERGRVAKKQLWWKLDAVVKIQKVIRGALALWNYQLYRGLIIYTQACWLRRREMIGYKKTRGAIITIQAEMRMSIYRKKYQSMISSIVTIQRIFRALIEYRKAIAACVKIQGCARMTIQRERFKTITSSAVIVQSLERRRVAKKQLWWKLDAVVKIQKVIRGTLALWNYQLYRGLIIYTQACWLRRREMIGYKKTRGAIITIQAEMRMSIYRKKYQRMISSIVTIQRIIRGTLTLWNYQLRRGLIIYTQACWMRRKEMISYDKKRTAILTIQSQAQTYLHRRTYKKRRSSIIILQSLQRSRIARKSHQGVRLAAVTIQKMVRGTLALWNYQLMRGLIIYTQACWLRRKEMIEYREKRGAIVEIQAWVRMIAMRRGYDEVIASVVTMQRIVRGTLTLWNFQLYRGIIIYTQACWWRRKEMIAYDKKRAAIIAIQSWIRMMVLQRKYDKTKSSIVTIQRMTRGTLILWNFQLYRGLIIYTQACWWRRKEMIAYHKKQAAIHTIQTWSRMSVQRRAYDETKSSIVTIQRIVRGTLTLWNFQLYRGLIIYTQACWLRRKEMISYDKKRAAIQTIQTWSRMAVQLRAYDKMKSSAITIQKLIRGTLSLWNYQLYRGIIIYTQACWYRRKEMISYKKKRSSAIAIQGWSRTKQQTILHKKRKKSIVIIQKVHRSRVVQKSHRVNIAAAVSIQRMVRGTMIMWKYQLHKGLAILIQACYRRRRDLLAYRETRAAVIAIQAWWRMSIQSQTYDEIIFSVVTIQRMVRGTMLMWKFQLYRGLAICCQASLRRRREMTIFREKRAAAIAIQGWARKNKQHRAKVAAAVTIQRMVRGTLMLWNYHLCIGLIIYTQACWWRRKESIAYREKRTAIISIQAWSRMINQRRAYDTIRKYRGQEMAALTIQKAVRRWKAQWWYYLSLGLIIYTQANWRRLKEKKSFLMKRQSAMIIQRMTRRCRLNTAATLIQLTWRKSLQQHKYQHKQRAAVLIQKNVRRWITQWYFCFYYGCIIYMQSMLRRHKERKLYLRKRQSAIKIQRLIRRFRRNTAATVIQLLWRGVLARRDCAVRRNVVLRENEVAEIRRAVPERAKATGVVTSAAAVSSSSRRTTTVERYYDYGEEDRSFNDKSDGGFPARSDRPRMNGSLRRSVGDQSKPFRPPLPPPPSLKRELSSRASVTSSTDTLNRVSVLQKELASIEKDGLDEQQIKLLNDSQLMLGYVGRRLTKIRERVQILNEDLSKERELSLQYKTQSDYFSAAMGDIQHDLEEAQKTNMALAESMKKNRKRNTKYKKIIKHLHRKNVLLEEGITDESLMRHNQEGGRGAANDHANPPQLFTEPDENLVRYDQEGDRGVNGRIHRARDVICPPLITQAHESEPERSCSQQAEDTEPERSQRSQPRPERRVATPLPIMEQHEVEDTTIPPTITEVHRLEPERSHRSQPRTPIQPAQEQPRPERRMTPPEEAKEPDENSCEQSKVKSYVLCSNGAIASVTTASKKSKTTDAEKADIIVDVNTNGGIAPIERKEQQLPPPPRNGFDQGLHDIHNQYDSFASYLNGSVWDIALDKKAKKRQPNRS